MHAKIQQKFVKDMPNHLIANDIKFTFDFIEVIDALILTNSPLLEQVRKNDQIDNPMDVSDLDERKKYIDSVHEHQSKVVQAQVTHLDDEPYSLSDEDMEAIPRTIITDLYNAITRSRLEETDRVRGFPASN